MANIDLTNALTEQLTAQNEDLSSQILELRQALQMNMPHHDEEEDNMDILVNEHMRDITRESRPQMSSAGLSVNNKHFKDLSNHELHKIKKMHMKEHSFKPRTILDEPLGDIMNRLVNFLTFSFEPAGGSTGGLWVLLEWFFEAMLLNSCLNVADGPAQLLQQT